MLNCVFNITPHPVPYFLLEKSVAHPNTSFESKLLSLSYLLGCHILINLLKA